MFTFTEFCLAGILVGVLALIIEIGFMRLVLMHDMTPPYVEPPNPGHSLHCGHTSTVHHVVDGLMVCSACKEKAG